MTNITSLDAQKDRLGDRLARVEQQLDTANKRLAGIESRLDHAVGTTSRLVTSTERLVEAFNVQKDNEARIVEILESHENSLKATAKALNDIVEFQREILSTLRRL